MLSQGLNAISGLRSLIPNQHMGMLKLSAAHYHFDARAFMYQAKYYAQDSKHPLFSCQKNAMTALQTGNYRACTTWHMLSTLAQGLDLLANHWDPATLVASSGVLAHDGYRPHESPYYPPDHLAQHYAKPNQVLAYVPTRLHYPANPPALQLPGHPRNYGGQRTSCSIDPSIPGPSINSAPAPGSSLARVAGNELNRPLHPDTVEQTMPSGLGKSAVVPTAHTVYSQPSSQYPSCHSSVRLKSRPDSPLLTHTIDLSSSNQVSDTAGSLQPPGSSTSALLEANRHSHSDPAMAATDECTPATNHGQRPPRTKLPTRSRVEFQPDPALTLSDPITTDDSAFPFPMPTGPPRPSAMTAWTGPFASDSRRASAADNLQRAQSTRGSGPSAVSSLMSPARLRHDPQVHASPLGSGVQLICEVMEFYASQGDVQMSVSIFFVFRPLIEPFVSRTKLSYWCADYVELLRRFKLHAIATDAGNRSQFTFLKKPTTQYSEIPTTCQFCSEIVMYSETGYWTCPSCHNIISRCVLCHLPIRGHIVWCRGCGHGGHVDHLTAWFQRHTSCPSGCGHECSVPFRSSLLPQV
ncbi:SEA (Seh1-associated) complex subunit [Dimargaris xerosporica]|nr:SEA (Seh1-associated) complex subunit [Dimargaris xerosporica]